METATEEPKGLGGWLILPAIGLFVMPIRLTLFLLSDFLPIFQEGYWEVLTTPGSEAYHHLWAPLITFEIIANTCFIIFAIVLIFMFFAKSYRFPTLFIVYLALNLGVVLIDFIAVGSIPAVTAEGNAEALRELLRAIVGTVIWIPYFLVSKRVKNTFLKPDSNIVLQPTAEGSG